MRFILDVLVVQPFAENTYLVGDADAGEAIVVDPGGRAEEIVRAASQNGVTVKAIVNTHSHIDHVSGVAALQELLDIPFWLHPDAEPMLQDLPQQAAMFGLPPIEAPTVDRHLVHGEYIAVGGLQLEVRDTPGHARGHVTLVGPTVSYEGIDRPFALCGDVVFRGSIGRVDLPGGDYGTLMRSIEREILPLPEDTLLFNGHGPSTTVGLEKASNPFIREWLTRKTQKDETQGDKTQSESS